MKNVYTVVGRPYAVTTSAACTVSTPDGVLIASCEPGYQVIFVAPCDVVQVSEDDAHVTATFSSAASAVSGGGMKRNLEAYVEQKAAEIADEQAETISNHAGSTLHLQFGERERWDSLIPPGTILPSACTSVAGYLLCDGASVSRSTYAVLFAAIGTRFGAGDGSSTFQLPDLRSRTLWGADSSAAPGTMLHAGLPDINGIVSAYTYSDGEPSGAFATRIDVRNVLNYGVDENSNGTAMMFHASRSDAIYGASDTVQPPALALNFFIKY